MNHSVLFWVLALAGVIMSFGEPAQADAKPDPAPANMAVAAVCSTSFVSGHETLAAMNDGIAPKASNDTSHGAYGNWPRRGTQWVQYDWPLAVSVNRVEIYWYDDARGVRVPAAARLKYHDGKDWRDIKADIGLLPNTFNSADFPEIQAKKLRLEIDGKGEFSTGVIEWRVLDSGKSPAFPPAIDAGPDRSVVLGGKTYLNAHARSIGKAGEKIELTWKKLSGPGEVHFEDLHSLQTSATFSALGEHQIALTAQASGLDSSDALSVRVVEAQKHSDFAGIETPRYKLNSSFWMPRFKGLIVNWIPHCINECDKPDLKEGGMNNIIEAGKKLAGKEARQHIGYPFSNAWVLNTLESMCVAQMVDAQGDQQILDAQKSIRDKIDEWIPLILAAQEPDGYFQTRFTLGAGYDRGRKAQRWDPRLRGDHEGYVAGYFIEAGIAHYLCTDGKDLRLYNAAKKLADCWYDNLGPAPKKPWYDGHQEMEMALFRLSRLVNEVDGAGKGDKYAQLAKFLLDNRGGGGQYDQSHLPVTRQYTAVGHAVRAVYNYSAMADAAKFSGDLEYQSAVCSIWDNLVNRKYYVTGGVGSGETSEGFGGDYSLPHHAYCESCSGCGELFFQHKMHLLFGQAKYADLYEETLYNAILSDIDLDGQNFTYTNALDSAEPRYKWHVCPCCVGNIPRTLLMLPTWMYSRSGDGININLFAASDMTIRNVAGDDLQIIQQTNYPWDGSVKIELHPQKEARFPVRVRVPHRSVSEIYTSVPEADGITSVKVNGQATVAGEDNGYVLIDRTWKPGDTIELELPMRVQRITASDKVASTRGYVALRYGPLVYNFESVDQDLNATLPPNATLKAIWSPDLLGGVMRIEAKSGEGATLRAVPNYTRNNRGGRSIVWIRAGK